MLKRKKIWRLLNETAVWALIYASSATITASVASTPQEGELTRKTNKENTNNSQNVSSNSEPNKVENEKNIPPIEEETIVVTGSHIRGTVAAGAHLDIYTRDDLDKSGYATVQDFINTLPQNFQGGGGSEDFSEGLLGQSNQLGGASINLRGLGADSTLILINGRRGPQSGLEGNFTDITTIPQTAIQRIEILPDGASALYGSDAVGGVVNFVLRKDFEGAETRLRYGKATEGDLDEIRLAQAVGHTWTGGHLLVSYEYYHRDALTYGERNFASTYDLRSRGGADYRLDYANPGNILDPATFQPSYAIPSNQDGRSLIVTDLIPNAVNLSDRPSEGTLLPKQKRHSIFLFGEQQVLNTLSLFTELRYSERKSTQFGDGYLLTVAVPETNPFLVDPYGVGYALVNYSLSEELGLMESKGKVRSGAAVGGAKLDLGSWRWEASLAYGREKSRQSYHVIDFNQLNEALADPNPETALNVFGDGKVNNVDTLTSLLDETVVRPYSQLFGANTIIDGPLTKIVGQMISGAFGLDYRSEKFRFTSSTAGETNLREQISRHIYSAFAEVFIPIFNEDNTAPLADKFDISIAGRVDRYSDVGSTVNPKIGARYVFSEGITVNATYGTSYRAPNLWEKTEVRNLTFISQQPDPKSPTGFTQTLILVGNDPEMRSEKATTWTTGVTIEPHSIKGLSFNVIYFHTKFRDRISGSNDLFGMLSQEHLYPNLITRNPTLEQIESICNSSNFISDIALCTPEFIKAIVDFRVQNMAVNKVRGLDGAINYGLNIGDISVSAGVSATYLIDATIQQTKTSPVFDRVDTLANPVDLRARSYISASSGLVSGTILVNYTDSYKNDRSLTQKKISSHTTIDLNVALQIINKWNMFPGGNVSVHLSAINIFNNDPPFADNNVGYDGSNADPLGRMISLEVKATW